MDELALLRSLITDEPERDPRAEAEVWRRLQRKRPARIGPALRRRPAVVVSGAAIAAVAAAAIAVLMSSVGVPTAEAACTHPSPSSTACLDELARLAAARLVSGRVVYQQAIELSPAERMLPPGVAGVGHHLRGVSHPFSVRRVTVTETWIDRTTWHGARRLSFDLSFPSARDRMAWRAAGSPSVKTIFGKSPGTTVARVAYGERLYTEDFGALQRATGSHHPDAALPTNPDGVLRVIRRLAAERRTSLAGGALLLPGEDPLLTPAQRSAIFSALTRVPGVRVVGTMADELGRSGVVVSTPWPGHGIWLTLYDARTGRMLADGATDRRNPRWLWTYVVDAATAPAVLEAPR